MNSDKCLQDMGLARHFLTDNMNRWDTDDLVAMTLEDSNNYLHKELETPFLPMDNKSQPYIFDNL